jgi:glycogen debranching enzyme
VTAVAPGPFESPVLLTSLASAVLADGRGDLRYARESRGATTEWGGVYGQLVRLTGPWTVALRSDGTSFDLPSTLVSSESSPGGWRSRHLWKGLEILQEVAAAASPAGAVRRLSLRSVSVWGTRALVTSRFTPFLLPVLVEGIRPTEFEVRTSAGEVAVQNHGFALRARSSSPPSRVLLNGRMWRGAKYRGPVGELATEHELVVSSRTPTEITWQVAGGLLRDLNAAVEGQGAALPRPEELAAQQVRDEVEWTAQTPELEFPDAPELEQAYRAARAALRRLYSAPGDGMVGLVAGYPWYSAIWCRDLAVMLPAVLWMGDFGWAHRSLRSVFRFQSRQQVKILAGAPGELPMQLTPGPIFLYGTSDSTLRFPKVVEQLHRHTGDLREVEEWSGALQRIVEWGRRRCDPATGLLRHGGEAEGMATATVALARVRYGIDAPDTTIWDSADRRDHAIDVQVLWYEALRATGRLLGHAADPRGKASNEQTAEALATTVRERYRWAEERYLYDSIRSGQPVRHVRPNALVAASAGLLDSSTAKEVVSRAADGDLSTPWGLRSLSSDDPGYDPLAYHEGEVWTIATAWAADAAFAVGDAERGLGYLRTVAARYRDEGGFANECYRGDRPEPFNSCYLLGFSVAPFLAVLFERLWGLRLSAETGSVRVVPCFPHGWSSARLRGLRVGEGRLDLAWEAGRLRARWQGPRPLSLDAGDGPRTLVAGEEDSFALPESSEPS